MHPPFSTPDYPHVTSTTDELAGAVLESWGNANWRRWALLTDQDYLDLREAVLTGIRDAIDQDRHERLDYEETDRRNRRRERGFMGMFSFPREAD